MAIAPLDSGDLLASTRDAGLLRLGRRGEVVERLAHSAVRETQYRALRRDAKQGIWIANKDALLWIDSAGASAKLRPEPLPNASSTEQVAPSDIDVDRAGRVWVGYAEGMAWQGSQGWQRIDTDRPVKQIRSFTIVDRRSGAEIWAAYRGAGKFSRLRKDGDTWRVRDFAVADGYTPEDTHFLKHDSRGWIWRGAPDGVHVSDGVHLEPEAWLHLDWSNGFASGPADQYGFFEDRDGTVWIGGEDGLTHMRPEAWWFGYSSVAPRITRMLVDGHEADPSSASFPEGAALRVEIGALGAPRMRDYALRYRFGPDEGWRYSRDGLLELAQKPRGSYQLEIVHANGGPVLVSSFQIGATGGRLGWFWWALPLPLGGSLALFGRWFPWSERNRYWLSKFLFLTRRRFSRLLLTDSAEDGGTAFGYCGTILADRYEVIRNVSEGGFSKVYEARDVLTDSRMAVKILNTALGTESWIRDRFALEIAALRCVVHPAVVSVRDCWITARGEPCIAMPFIEGPTLRQALESGPWSPRTAAKLIQDLGAALSSIHKKGVVHRDLKPENILLREASNLDVCQPVIIDFGAAGLRGPKDQLVVTTLLSGSFHYMAPERLTGHYSPASDIYSLAVIVLELLTRKRLSDIGVLSGDADFQCELRRLLSTVIASDKLEEFTRLLSAGYRSAPHERPTDAGEWSAALSVLLLGADGEMRSAIHRMPNS